MKTLVITLLRRTRRFLLQGFGRWLTVEQGCLGSVPGIRVVATLAPRVSRVHRHHRLSGFLCTLDDTSILPPRNGQYVWPELKLYLLHNAHLAGSRAVPLTPGRKLITEHTGGTSDTMLSQHVALRPSKILFNSILSVSERLDVAYSISSPFAWNYFHWLTDCLPCLIAYEAIPEPAILLLPSDLSSWQLDSLALMGYPPSSWKSYGGLHVRVGRLYLSSWPKNPHRHYSTPHPSLLAMLRQRILASPATESTDQQPERLFIDRSRAGKRRIGNHLALHRVFEERGFVAVRLEELPFTSQVALFRSARWVAGVHGAGFTNLVFSERNPFVFEIFAQGDVHSFYADLLQVVGGIHRCYVADADERGNSIVNPERLAAVLDLFLAEPGES